MRNVHAGVMLLVLGGCTSQADLESLDPSEAFERTYVVPHTRALAAVRDSLGDHGFSIRDEKEFGGESWRLLAFQPAGGGSTGRHARIQVIRTSKGVAIRMVVKSRLGARTRSIGDGEAALDVLSSLDRRLR